MGGRPTKMTEEVMKRILDDIAMGTPKSSAFVANGICEKTGFNWANNDPAFSALMETAEHAFLNNGFHTIYTAGTGTKHLEGDWKAMAALIKMRHPEFRDKGVEVNVKAEASASNVALSQEDLEDIRRLNREAITGGPN